jgi:hypothetical protein
MQCQSSRGQCKWLLLCLSAKRCPTQGLTRSGPTGASGTDTQCFVAVDRGSITESIKWLAHVAVTENGIREDESRGVAALLPTETKYPPCRLWRVEGAAAAKVVRIAMEMVVVNIVASQLD